MIHIGGQFGSPSPYSPSSSFLTDGWRTWPTGSSRICLSTLMDPHSRCIRCSCLRLAESFVFSTSEWCRFSCIATLKKSKNMLLPVSVVNPIKHSCGHFRHHKRTRKLTRDQKAISSKHPKPNQNYHGSRVTMNKSSDSVQRQLFLVVSPGHQELVAACESSKRRLTIGCTGALVGRWF